MIKGKTVIVLTSAVQPMAVIISWHKKCHQQIYGFEVGKLNGSITLNILCNDPDVKVAVKLISFITRDL